jgi:hypothetical protein
VIAIQTFRTDALSSSGPRPVAGAKWHTLLTATARDGQRATLSTAPQRGGGVCFAVRYGTTGAGGSGCVPRHWKGPALQLSFSPYGSPEPAQPRFLTGNVRPGIVAVAVRLADGRVLHPEVVDGFVLAELPAGVPRAKNVVVGFDTRRSEVARAELPTR